MAETRERRPIHKRFPIVRYRTRESKDLRRSQHSLHYRTRLILGTLSIQCVSGENDLQSINDPKMSLIQLSLDSEPAHYVLREA